ncbi:ankyrin repeat domain-containing protein [Streptomyces sp. NPDC005146]
MSDQVRSPAHHAVEHEDAETLAQLLDAGADPNEVEDGMTLLTHAIDAEGDGAMQQEEPLTVHTTAVLLAYGADPRLADPRGEMPVSVAERYGHELALRLLRRYLAGDLLR